DHRQAGGASTPVQPCRTRPPFKPNPLEPQTGRTKIIVERRRVARRPALPDDSAVLIDDANRRFFHRHVQSREVFHGLILLQCCNGSLAVTWRTGNPGRRATLKTQLYYLSHRLRKKPLPRQASFPYLWRSWRFRSSMAASAARIARSGPSAS